MLAGIAVFVLFVTCSRAGRATVVFDDATLHPLIADEPGERSRGLQGVSGFSAGDGMLFVWPGEGVRVFAIKGVGYPLDLVFIDERFVVVGVARLDPQGATLASHPSPARLVLEVPAGFVKRHDIAVGDGVALDGVD